MSEPCFIDAHCHLSDSRMKDRARIAIREAQAAGVGAFFLGGVESQEWHRQLELKREFPNLVRTSYGIHPWTVERLSREALEQEFLELEREITNADALGETGLDFYKSRNPDRFSDQEEFFRRQLDLAKAYRKPLVLHVVKAHARAMERVKDSGPEVPIVVHSFSGSVEEAKAWARMGAFLSFSGGIAREGAGASQKSKEALRGIPLSSLLFETDSPDQAFRPGVHEPRLVIEVYEAASRILQVPLSELKEIVAENFSKIR